MLCNLLNFLLIICCKLFFIIGVVSFKLYYFDFFLSLKKNIIFYIGYFLVELYFNVEIFLLS